MRYFQCDYVGGATDKVLKALCDSNEEQTVGYGEDPHCARARAMIQEKCARPDAAVHFVAGGTQANLTVIAAALRPFEGVLCADTGHINGHETGAVEATGHKVIALAQRDGKVEAADIRRATLAQRKDANREHIVRPGMVYLSHPTELGTLYTREELEAIAGVCGELGLYLFVDGARLGYGLAAEPRVDLPLLARLCDAFTIGGTKAGLLFGEAIVLTHPALMDGFRYHIKQRGGMLAKGRLLGVQFEALMEGDYYVALCARANRMAQEMKSALLAKGCALLCDTPTNQIFPILPNRALEALAERFRFSFWGAVDQEHSAVRICTSVLTTDTDADALLQALRALAL